jgi:hypothetical protein
MLPSKFCRNNNGLILECSACGHKIRSMVGIIFQDTSHLLTVAGLTCLGFDETLDIEKKYGKIELNFRRTIYLFILRF